MLGHNDDAMISGRGNRQRGGQLHRYGGWLLGPEQAGMFTHWFQ